MENQKSLGILISNITTVISDIYNNAEWRLAIAIALSKNPLDFLKSYVITEIISHLSKNVETSIINGITQCWKLNDSHTKTFVENFFKGRYGSVPDKLVEKYSGHNESALKSFITRKTSGLNLSERVWKYTSDYQRQLNNALQIGIGNGVSANKMAGYLVKYLQNPTTTILEVDQKGVAKEIENPTKPQAGVYNSPKKNAMRLARTETNIAYHTADQDHWNKMDFVVGYEIKLSGNHTTMVKGKPVPLYDMCDELKGKYPKNFKFVGWHPQCRCYTTAILKTDEELDMDDSLILEGKEPTTTSVNEVKDVPDNFKTWIKDNQDRLKKSKSLPYFVRDNKEIINRILN